MGPQGRYRANGRLVSQPGRRRTDSRRWGWETGLAILVAFGAGVAVGALAFSGSTDPADDLGAGPSTTVPQTADSTTTVPVTTDTGGPTTTLPAELRDIGGRLIVVDPSRGRADGTGTTDDPMQSLATAIEAAEPGGTIVLREGTYVHTPGDLPTTIIGTPDEWITIRGWPRERAIIAPTDGDGLRLTDSMYVEIRDLEFAGPSSATTGAGIRVDKGSRHIRVVDNLIYGFAAHGVGITQASAVFVEGNEMHDLANRSPFQTSAISLYQPQGDPTGDEFDNVIRNNVVYRTENLVPRDDGQFTDGNCIIIDDGRNEQGNTATVAYEGTTLVENNVCYDNGGRGIFVFKSDNVVVRFNTLFHNLRSDAIDGAEITVSQASNVSIRSNFVWPSDGEDHLSIDDADEVEVSLNLVTTTIEPASGFAVVADPLLLDPTTDDQVSDFRIGCASSELVNRGGTDFPGTDGRGVERGTPADVGALEYSSTDPDRADC